MNVHDKVALNIIKYLDTQNIEYKDNKIKEYSIYLSKVTALRQKRLETILSVGTKRRITIMEVLAICDGLQITPAVILDGIKD